MASRKAIDVDDLAQRADWVRGLARALVHDENEADDLAQDAWVVALTRSARTSEAWSAWIGATMRNLARARWRSERRREARESEVARSEAQAPDSASSDPLDAHEALLRAVRALDEPYREVIALRFFEGLPPRLIATRLGLPVKTVDTRLYRALGQLRSTLDKRHGDRAAWLALLIPLTRPRNLVAAGALAVSLKLMIAASVVVLVVAWLTRERGASDASVAAVVPSAAPVESMDPTVTSTVTASERAPAETLSNATTTSLPDASATTASTAVLRGSVVDASGEGLAGIEVVFTKPDSDERLPGLTALTDSHGDFEIASPPADARLDIAAPAWVVVLRPRSLEADLPHVIVLAPRRTLAGRVVDETGAPIEAVSVALAFPHGLRASIDRVLERCYDQRWTTRTNALGAFLFTRAPDLRGCSLTTMRAGFDDGRAEVSTGDRLEVEIVLKRHSPESQHLLGRVFDAQGSPVGDAFVAFLRDHGNSDALVRTNNFGEFDLPSGSGASGPRRVMALKAGFLPGEVESVWDEVQGLETWPAPLELVLAGTPLSIEGVVLDANGKTLTGAVVENLDTTRFGDELDPRGSFAVHMPRSVEALLRGAPDMAVTAAADGRFEVCGLLAKSYRLRVLDPMTLEMTVTEPIAAGTRDAQIRLPGGERIERISGRVIDASRLSVPGATVCLHRHVPPPHDTRRFRLSATTDEEGVFEFRDVSAAVDQVLVYSPGGMVGPTSVLISSLASLEGIEVVIPVVRKCHFRIDASASMLAVREFAVLDAQGNELDLYFEDNGGSWAAKRGEVREAGSEAVGVSVTATTLVLYGEDDTELLRKPLKLVPGELTTIRL